MGVDRILQLKLISDVADINSKMGQVTQDVGKAQKAFGQLKSFIGPVFADIGLKLGGMVVDSFQEQLKHAEELRNALIGLKAPAQAIGLSAKDIGKVSDELRDMGVSLGVGEDAKIVGALRDILGMTENLKLSERAVAAIFDVMRQFDVDFDTAKGIVVNGIILGRARYLDQLGIKGDNANQRLKDFNQKFGAAAEEFAQTADGKWQVATAQWDGHMLNLAILVDQAMLDLKGALVVGWDNLTGIVDGIATIWTGLQDKWGEPIQDAVDKISEILGPVAEVVTTLVTEPFDAMTGILGAIWKTITGDIEGARDDIVSMVRGLANTLIDLLNQISQAFAFDASFEIPSFEIPDPTQLLEGGTIKIGGGTIDLSRGPLFDAIPHLAQGGIIRRPTLALIGESGPEAVVPLGRGAGNTYQITVHAAAASPADVGRAVVEAIEAYERRAGARWRS